MDGVPGSLAGWDMDNDSDQDLVVVVDDENLSEPVIRVLRNDSSANLVAFTLFDPLAQGENPRLVTGSDVSGDELDDLISVNVVILPMNATGDAGRFGPRDSTLSIRPALPEPRPVCRADIAPANGDGNVGVPDLLAVINAWGPCVDTRNCPADIAPLPNGDDAVGVPDLLAIINAWGPCP